MSNCQYFVNANFVRQTKTPRLLTALLVILSARKSMAKTIEI
ncbi:hypothetical protein KF201_0912 [Lactococcus lactis subsp. lactis]|uniref:Uncharacterized protein n=1 Tax=Lactococcus lactis subsp. lactis TaxID=1360 RepID=A0A0V8ECM2_LACLL|nr:hypothetical protein Llab_1879 [Lactococcus lactis]KSU02263.1 hypothetical protein KF201_0912 [Lactococcus lactis subsp. lactis]KSU23539.1 hypothetical protein M20_0037 [Lactococcus lactis subsp. lactis]